MDEKVKKVNKLIKAVACGDMGALEQLYQEVGGLLLLMARKYLFDRQSAEDLVSETFLKLVRTASTFKEGNNGLNWLFKTVKNGAINANIKANRAEFVPINEQTLISSVFEEEGIVNGMLVGSALKHLNELELEVITKKYWEGLTVREIASAMGVSASRTQRLIKSALKIIGAHIKESKGGKA